MYTTRDRKNNYDFKTTCRSSIIIFFIICVCVYIIIPTIYAEMHVPLTIGLEAIAKIKEIIDVDDNLNTFKAKFDLALENSQDLKFYKEVLNNNQYLSNILTYIVKNEDCEYVTTYENILKEIRYIENIKWFGKALAVTTLFGIYLAACIMTDDIFV